MSFSTNFGMNGGGSIVVDLNPKSVQKINLALKTQNFKDFKTFSNSMKKQNLLNKLFEVYKQLPDIDYNMYGEIVQQCKKEVNDLVDNLNNNYTGNLEEDARTYSMMSYFKKNNIVLKNSQKNIKAR